MSRISRHISVSDLKRTRQKQIDEQKELAVKKLKVEKKLKHLEEMAKSLKSDWRKDIGKPTK
jgi:hypothetical protein